MAAAPVNRWLHASRIAYEVKNTTRFGIYCQEAAFASVDFSKVNGQVEQAIAAIQPHHSPERFRGLGRGVMLETPGSVKL